MKSILKSVILVKVFFILSITVNAQARLTIENNSQRSMTVKVMQGNGGRGRLHQTTTIGAYRSETVYFSESGNYFTKTKAVLKGKDPVYRKGQPFKVTNDATGYSIMRLTFSIKESSLPQATGGKSISKTEFDEN